MRRLAPERPHTLSGLIGEPAYRQCFQLRQVVSLSLTSLEDVMRPRKKAAHVGPRLTNVELRLRLITGRQLTSGRALCETHVILRRVTRPSM